MLQCSSSPVLFKFVLCFLSYFFSQNFWQSIGAQKHDRFQLKAKIKYTGKYMMAHIGQRDFLIFFSVHRKNILLSYPSISGKLKYKTNASTKLILRNIFNAEKYNILMLSDQNILLQRPLFGKAMKIIQPGLNGIPTEFAVISKGKIKIRSQVKGAVNLLPILDSNPMRFNAIGDWRGSISLKPLFKINQSGKVLKTIQIENKTPRKGYHLYDLDLVTLLGKQQYLITNQYSKDSRCVRTYLEFKVLDVPRKALFELNNRPRKCLDFLTPAEVFSESKMLYPKTC